MNTFSTSTVWTLGGLRNWSSQWISMHFTEHCSDELSSSAKEYWKRDLLELNEINTHGMRKKYWILHLRRMRSVWAGLVRFHGEVWFELSNEDFFGSKKRHWSTRNIKHLIHSLSQSSKPCHEADTILSNSLLGTMRDRGWITSRARKQ